MGSAALHQWVLSSLKSITDLRDLRLGARHPKDALMLQAIEVNEADTALHHQGNGLA